MIAHLRGRLLSKQPQQVIVEAAGVGYDVAISVSTYTSLPAEGAEVALHIHTQVREDTLALYGFLDRNDKRIFERLNRRFFGSALRVPITWGRGSGRARSGAIRPLCVSSRTTSSCASR